MFYALSLWVTRLYRQYEKWLRTKSYRVYFLLGAYIVSGIFLVETVARSNSDSQRLLNFVAVAISLATFPFIFATLLIARTMLKEWSEAVKRLPRK